MNISLLHKSFKWGFIFTTCFAVNFSFVSSSFADALLDIDGSAEKIVNPQIRQKEFTPAKIESESIELLAYTGLYSFEHFDSRPMIGLKGSYHFNNRFFLDLDYGSSSVKGKVGAISIDENLSRYDLGIGFNLIEGRAYWESGFALSNELYIKFAKGKMNISETSDYTSFGMGVRLLHPNDKLCFQTGFNKDSVDGQGGGTLKTSHNLSFFMGIGMYF